MSNVIVPIVLIGIGAGVVVSRLFTPSVTLPLEAVSKPVVKKTPAPRDPINFDRFVELNQKARDLTLARQRDERTRFGLITRAGF